MTVGSVRACVPERQSTRRGVLKAASATTLGSALSALAAADATAPRLVPEPHDETDEADETFDVRREAAESVFPHSVASGGPTPTGVLLWTRIARDASSE